MGDFVEVCFEFLFGGVLGEIGVILLEIYFVEGSYYFGMGEGFC